MCVYTCMCVYVCVRVIEINEQKKRKKCIVTRGVGGPSGYCANDYLEAR